MFWEVVFVSLLWVEICFVFPWAGVFTSLLIVVHFCCGSRRYTFSVCWRISYYCELEKIILLWAGETHITVSWRNSVCCELELAIIHFIVNWKNKTKNLLMWTGIIHYWFYCELEKLILLWAGVSHFWFYCELEKLILLWAGVSHFWFYCELELSIFDFTVSWS